MTSQEQGGEGREDAWGEVKDHTGVAYGGKSVQSTGYPVYFFPLLIHVFRILNRNGSFLDLL